MKEVSGSYKWITRVPETLSEAKEILETLDGGMLQKTSSAGYHLFSTSVEYGGVKQRWIVVFSEKAFSREREGEAGEEDSEREGEGGEGDMALL